MILFEVVKFGIVTSLLVLVARKIEEIKRPVTNEKYNETYNILSMNILQIIKVKSYLEQLDIISVILRYSFFSHFGAYFLID